MNIDLGNEGGGGPYLAWSAKGTEDGQIDPRTFYLRESDGKTPVDAKKGMVLDLSTLKTGWCHSEGAAGVAPNWQWNQSPSLMAASPGKDWKKGMSIRVGLPGGKSATWEQSGQAAWLALTHLAPQLSEKHDPNQLPKVKLVAADPVKFTKGATVVPKLDIDAWIDRPESLMAEGVAVATEPEPASPPSDDDLF